MPFLGSRFGFLPPQTLIVEPPAAPAIIFGLFGDNRIAHDGAVDLAWLGGGDDVFKGFGTVNLLLAGDGDDRVKLHDTAATVRLGLGDDKLTALDFVETVTASGGRTVVKLVEGGGSVQLADDNDRVEIGGTIGTLATGAGRDLVSVVDGGSVDLGAGRDRLTVEGFVETIEGGNGRRDLLDLGARNAGDFDILVADGTVLLQDRFTAETMSVTGIEGFRFDDRSYDLAELTARFGPDAEPQIQVGGGTQVVTINDHDPTISVIWDRVVQQAVIDTEAVAVGPTVASRAYSMMHTAMYDAWAAYDPTAVRISFDGADGDNGMLDALAEPLATDAEKAKAMSYAAVTVLQALFPDQEALVAAVMEDRLGHSLAPDGSIAAQVGVDAAEDLLALRADDGSNQAGNFAASATDYTPLNTGPDAIVDITRWTPERVPIDSGTGPLQGFLTPQWQFVESFALAEDAAGETDHADHRPPPPQAFFTAAFADATLDLEAQLITHNGATFEVSKDLIGTVINPGFIEQAEEVVAFSANLTDEEKVLAEFAEDGIDTAFPPGTFMGFAQYVSARDDHDLDTDARLFVAMANAMLDAGVSTWEAKTFYDYARPVRAIRELGKLGLIGEFDEELGGYAIEAFAGPGLGTQTILAENFVTFQRFTTDPSPPFAEYTSGHSAFSAAGAEVLQLFTGSDAFGASVTFAPGSTQFEAGVPAEEVTLEWETFSDAADDNGQSRLFGGIHFHEGDLYGRALGRQVGEQAFQNAQRFFDGSATDADRPFWTPAPDAFEFA